MNTKQAALMCRAMGVSARIEGMKAENRRREHNGVSPTYRSGEFSVKAQELDAIGLEILAAEHVELSDWERITGQPEVDQRPDPEKIIVDGVERYVLFGEEGHSSTPRRPGFSPEFLKMWPPKSED